VLSRRLWEAHLPVAISCRDHPFVQGIASGDLDRRAFQHYVAQDAFFLEAFTRAHAHCLARAPERVTMHAFRQLLNAAEAELELHRGYAERWGVELDADPTPATSAYTDFLLRVAATEPPGHVVAAMAPCMRLYAWLGIELEAVASQESAYYDWVVTYASDGFQEHAATLDGLLDGLLADEAVAASHYATGMRFELAFFESSFNSG